MPAEQLQFALTAQKLYESESLQEARFAGLMQNRVAIFVG